MVTKRSVLVLMVTGAFCGTIGLFTTGCGKPVAEVRAYQPAKDYARPLPPGAPALRKLSPAEYPDFSSAWNGQERLAAAIRHSLDYLAKMSSHRYFPIEGITHTRVVASLERMLELCAAVRDGDELNAILHREFDVYQSVGWDSQGTVFFTGYYTPIFDGRLQRDAEFRYPLYRLPPDLVKDEEGQTLGQRQADGSLRPYPSRQQIEQGRLLDGHEIAWMRSAFEAYVITVQGSARLRLADGSLYEIGYAGNNGHDYTAISKQMIQDGVIGRGDLSLQKLLAYFRDHPKQTFHYAWKNERYVFFQNTAGGPFGSLNTPVIAGRTVATDKTIFPRAALTFVDAELPARYDGQIVTQRRQLFTLDQDTGGAIRAAGRCDLYLGIGPDAEAVAGRTGSEGRLYYLFVRG